MYASEKRPFDIDLVMERVGEAVRPFPKAAMFELADEGFASVFEQLIACIISIRTRDEESLLIARRLFAGARTAEQIAQLTSDELAALLRPATFYERKAEQILAIARRVVSDHGGILPCDPDVLQSFTGVGPKCANLALGIACGQSRISVDVHVHRVTNRWGYVQTRAPEQTMLALEAALPRAYWVAINRYLVPFGKHICTGTLPRCSICPVLAMCRQVGITAHR